MRLVAPFVFIALAFAAMYALAPEGKKSAATVSVIALCEDYEYYDGVAVTIRTDSMQKGDSPGELVYRKRASQPPVLIVTFTPPIPPTQPAKLTGVFRRGTPHRLENAQPIP